MNARHEITMADIMPVAEYAKIRMGRRKELAARKKNRRVDVGPHVTFYFENFDTMWSQVHEMLYIEKGGEEQAKDEIEAYNPLIPKGRELVATFMVEVDDPLRRFLVELQMSLHVSMGRDVWPAGPRADGIEVRHARPAHHALYEPHLGCPVRFGASRDAIRCSARQ